VKLRLRLIALNSLSALVLSACASSPPPHVNERVAELERDLEHERSRRLGLERELADRREELQRMESALALLRADRELRGTAIERREDGLPTWDEPEPLNDGDGGSSLMKAPPESRSVHAASEGSEPRVTLRLYGERGGEARGANQPVAVSTVALPALPQTSATPVLQAAPQPARQDAAINPLPPAKSSAAGTPAHAPQAAEASDAAERAPIEASYRKALSLIREGQLEEALAPLEAVIQGSSDVSRRFDGVYWRGEVNFLLKRYPEAEVDFASIASLPNAHARLPSALLRLGHCMRARGRDSAAAEYWKRLNEDFPTSSAAQQIPQEVLQKIAPNNSPNNSHKAVR